MAVWLHAILTLDPTARHRTLTDWLGQLRQAEIGDRGGQLWGLWDGRCGLGFGADDVILMSMWPDDASAGAAVEVMKTLPQVIAVNGTPLHPALRPLPAQPVSGPGIWAFRDVHLTTVDLDAFLHRSASAWQSCETEPDRDAVGLFRCPNVDAETASLLLITRHPDVTVQMASQDEHNSWADIGSWEDGRPFARWSRARGATLQPLPRRSPTSHDRALFAGHPLR